MDRFSLQLGRWHCGAARWALTFAALTTVLLPTVCAQNDVSATPGNATAQRRARSFVRGRTTPAATNTDPASTAAGATALHTAQTQHAAMSTAVARLRTNAVGGVSSAATTSLSTAWQAVGPMQVSTAAYGLVTGRVTSVAVDPSDTTGNTVYLGTTGGGVWKSTNANAAAGSVTFSPLTDTLSVYSPNTASSASASLSIGAMSVQPGGTGVLLAGTGDPNDATDSYYGEGILRSTDGGTTWMLVQQSNDGAAGNHSFLGEGFAGFAWSSTNTSLVVAAVSSSAEGVVVSASSAGASARGLYFSTDAGVTWQMATITDGTQPVQTPADNFSATYEATPRPPSRGTRCGSGLSRLFGSTDTMNRPMVRRGRARRTSRAPA